MQSETAGIKATMEALRKLLENTGKRCPAGEGKALGEQIKNNLPMNTILRGSYATLSKSIRTLPSMWEPAPRTQDDYSGDRRSCPSPRIVLNIVLAGSACCFGRVVVSLHNFEASKVARDVAFPLRKDHRVRRQGKVFS
jgi:hypothetical protein